MDKKEFVKTCVLCGYASKKNAIAYAKSKDELTEDDYADGANQNLVLTN